MKHCEHTPSTYKCTCYAAMLAGSDDFAAMVRLRNVYRLLAWQYPHRFNVKLLRHYRLYRFLIVTGCVIHHIGTGSYMDRHYSEKSSMKQSICFYGRHIIIFFLKFHALHAFMHEYKMTKREMRNALVQFSIIFSSSTSAKFGRITNVKKNYIWNKTQCERCVDSLIKCGCVINTSD